MTRAPQELIDHCSQLIADHGERGAAAMLRVEPRTVLRVAAGARVQAGTIAHLELRLAELGEAQPTE